jgi:hypothetical protein
MKRIRYKLMEDINGDPRIVAKYSIQDSNFFFVFVFLD